MTVYATPFATGRQVTPAPSSSDEQIIVEFKYTLTAALVANDILKLGYLPANMIPSDFMFHGNVATATADFGILDSESAPTAILTDAASGGGKWATAAALTGLVRMSAVAALDTVINVNDNRPIGLKIVTGGGSAGQIIKLQFKMRPGP